MSPCVKLTAHQHSVLTLYQEFAASLGYQLRVKAEYVDTMPSSDADPQIVDVASQDAVDEESDEGSSGQWVKVTLWSQKDLGAKSFGPFHMWFVV